MIPYGLNLVLIVYTANQTNSNNTNCMCIQRGGWLLRDIICRQIIDWLRKRAEPQHTTNFNVCRGSARCILLFKLPPTSKSSLTLVKELISVSMLS
jgi:hypothetical protein